MRKQSSVLAFETRLKQETRLRLAMDTSLASLNTRFSEAFFSRVDNGVFACFTALFLCVVLRFLPVDLWPRPWPLGGGVVNPDAIPDGCLRSIALPLSSLSFSCSFPSSRLSLFLGREFQIGREISRLLSLVFSKTPSESNCGTVVFAMLSPGYRVFYLEASERSKGRAFVFALLPGTTRGFISVHTFLQRACSNKRAVVHDGVYVLHVCVVSM